MNQNEAKILGDIGKQLNETARMFGRFLDTVDDSKLLRYDAESPAGKSSVTTTKPYVDVAEEAETLHNKAQVQFSRVRSELGGEQVLDNFTWRGRTVAAVRWDYDDSVVRREIDEHFRLIHGAIGELMVRLDRLDKNPVPDESMNPTKRSVFR